MKIPRFVNLISVLLLTEPCLQTAGAESPLYVSDTIDLGMIVAYPICVNFADEFVVGPPQGPEYPPGFNSSSLGNSSSIGFSSTYKEPTHQHPEFTPPELIEHAEAADEALRSAASRLTRRDATKCLADGTCADGRYVILATERGFAPPLPSSHRLFSTSDLISAYHANFVSCCNTKGTCGYGPDNCGAGNVSVSFFLFVMSSWTSRDTVKLNVTVSHASSTS